MTTAAMLPITPEQCRAGRRLLGWNGLDLALRAKVNPVAAVRSRGGELLQATGTNKACRQTLACGIADREESEGSLGLRAPVAVGRNLDRAKPG